MYLCMHNVQENERKNTINKITVMGFEPSTFACKKNSLAFNGADHATYAATGSTSVFTYC